MMMMMVLEYLPVGYSRDGAATGPRDTSWLRLQDTSGLADGGT